MNHPLTDWPLFALPLPAAPALLVGTYMGSILGVLCRDLTDT